MKCAILISLHNAENTLDRAFESIMAQTFQGFRIIVINDASSDDTKQCLIHWQEKFGAEKFTLINNKRNIGLTHSLNKGLDFITEPYTARIDGDDWWNSTKLERQISFLDTHPEYGIVGSWYENITSKKTVVVCPPIDDDSIRMTIFKRNPFAHSCVLFRTELVRDTGGYDERVRYGQDYDLWLRLLSKTKFYNIADILCYRNATNGISFEKQNEQMRQCIKTQIKYIRKYRGSLFTYRFLLEPLLVIITPQWLRNLKRKWL